MLGSLGLLHVYEGVYLYFYCMCEYKEGYAQDSRFFRCHCQVLSLEGLSPVTIMARRKKDPATTTVHEVLASLQTWMDGKETIKATLAQSYLNIHRIALGSAGGVWSVLRQARVREICIVVHVGGTRCVTSSTDHTMKIHARIILTVEFDV